MCSGGIASLKSSPNDKFLRSFSWQIYLFSEFFKRNLLRGSCRRNIILYSFCWRCLIWRLNRGIKSNKPTYYHYTTLSTRLQRRVISYSGFLSVRLIQLKLRLRNYDWIGDGMRVGVTWLHCCEWLLRIFFVLSLNILQDSVKLSCTYMGGWNIFLNGTFRECFDTVS